LRDDPPACARGCPRCQDDSVRSRLASPTGLPYSFGNSRPMPR
jgi:hypothetical protein